MTICMKKTLVLVGLVAVIVGFFLMAELYGQDTTWTQRHIGYKKVGLDDIIIVLEDNSVIRKTEMREIVYLVERFCDVDTCSGMMERFGYLVLDSLPQQYPHRCNDCSIEANFEQIYPYYERKYIEVTK